MPTRRGSLLESAECRTLSVGGYTLSDDLVGTDDDHTWRGDVDRLRASIRVLAQSVGEVPSAADRAAFASSALEALEQEATELQSLRLAAIATLRTDGYSYDRIAVLTGLSKARVAQLSRAARKR